MGIVILTGLSRRTFVVVILSVAESMYSVAVACFSNEAGSDEVLNVTVRGWFSAFIPATYHSVPFWRAKTTYFPG